MIRQTVEIGFGRSSPRAVLQRSYVLNNHLSGEVVIPKGFTDIEVSAFKDMKNITRIVLPKTLLHIDERAFWGCERLEEIMLPDGVESIGDEAFYGCKSLEYVRLPSGLRIISKELFKNCLKLRTVTGLRSVRCVEDGAFWNCRSLAAIEFGGKIEAIGVYAFYRCERLEKLSFKGTVKCLKSHCFDGAGLRELFLPEGLEQIRDGAFLHCGRLRRLVLPKSLLAIGSYAFAGCAHLTKIIFQGGVPAFGPAAFPSNARVVCRWNQDSRLLMEARGFKLCRKQDGFALYLYHCPETAVLEFETYPKDTFLLVFGIREIPPRGYCGREKIRKVLIGEGVECIGQKAFADCKSLGEVTFPKSLKTVSEGAFKGCPVEELIIPENVACIERFSFRDTKRLRRVDFLGKAELDNQVFAGSAVKALYLHRGMALRPFLMQAVTLLCQPEEEGMIAFFKSMGYAVSDAGAWKALRLTHYRQVVSVPPPGALVEPSVRHIGKLSVCRPEPASQNRDRRGNRDNRGGRVL